MSCDDAVAAAAPPTAPRAARSVLRFVGVGPAPRPLPDLRLDDLLTLRDQGEGVR